MKSIDINTCTVKDLCVIPGIDRGVANAILRYRSSKRKVCDLDELQHLSEMSRSKFFLLKRNCHALKDKQHRMYQTSGRHHEVNKSGGAYDFPSLSHIKMDSRLLSSAIKVPKSGQFEVAGAPLTGNTILPRTKTATAACTQGTLASESKNVPQNIVRPKTAPEKMMQKTGSKKEDTSEFENACLEFEQSASGLNIKLSCQIDKKLLHKYVAAHEKFKDTEPIAQHIAQHLANPHKERPSQKDREQPAIIDEHLDSISDYAKNRRHDKKAELVPVQVYKVCTPSPTKMTVDNMVKFEQMKSLSPSEKKQRIKEWIQKVNQARRNYRVDTEVTTINTDSSGSSTSHIPKKAGRGATDTDAETAAKAMKLPRTPHPPRTSMDPDKMRINYRHRLHPKSGTEPELLSSQVLDADLPINSTMLSKDTSLVAGASTRCSTTSRSPDRHLIRPPKLVRGTTVKKPLVVDTFKRSYAAARRNLQHSLPKANMKYRSAGYYMGM